MDSIEKVIIDVREIASSNGIYLYSLPTYMTKTGKVWIKWINSAGCVIKIYKVYENERIIDLTVVIERYDKKTKKVYFVGYEKGIFIGDLIRGYIGEIFAPTGRKLNTQPIAITHPDKVPYFLNPEDAYKYTSQSNKKVLFICPICGQTHEMRISDFINNGFTCPNKTCQNSQNYKQSEAMKGKHAGVNNPMYGRTGVNSPMYGRTGENHPNYGKKRSEESKQKQSEAIKGENNHNWQGGITPIRNHLRTIIDPFMKAHKKALNKTCEITGKNGEDGHHIYPFINIVHDAHNKYNISIKPNVCDYSAEELKQLEDYVLSWHVIGDWSNMILLADEVHNQFHKKYGTVYDPTLTVEATYQRMEEFKLTWSSTTA